MCVFARARARVCVREPSPFPIYADFHPLKCPLLPLLLSACPSFVRYWVGVEGETVRRPAGAAPMVYDDALPPSFFSADVVIIDVTDRTLWGTLVSTP